MDPPVRMGVVVTSILHESIHGLLYFYLSHFILQFVNMENFLSFIDDLHHRSHFKGFVILFPHHTKHNPFTQSYVGLNSV